MNRWRDFSLGGAKAWIIMGPLVVLVATIKGYVLMGLIGVAGILMGLYILVSLTIEENRFQQTNREPPKIREDI